jgi:hypothetical protein
MACRVKSVKREMTRLEAALITAERIGIALDLAHHDLLQSRENQYGQGTYSSREFSFELRY